MDTKKPKAKTKKTITAKQAETGFGALMRGLDNSEAKLKKGIAEIGALKGQVKQLSQGLSNALKATAKPVPVKAAKPASKPKPAKPAKKPAAAKKPVSAAKAAKPPAAKPASAAKPAKPAKAAKAAKPAKETKAKPEHKDPVTGRPVVREALKAYLQDGKTPTRREAYDALCAQYGYWSRQSFYGILKKDPEFQIAADGRISLRKADDVDSFVSKVAEDTHTAAMV